VCILGDLVADAARPDAAEAQAQLLDQVRQAADEAPVYLVRGNHDLPAEQIPGIDAPGPRAYRLGPIRIICFDDRWDDADVCTRPEEHLEALADLAQTPGDNRVALQHNPIHPPIASDDYPYMPANRERIMAAYHRAAVGLSLSGHYHPGAEPAQAGDTVYAAVPALCEAPYHYLLATLDGGKWDLSRRALQLGTAYIDSHVHTQLAYCGSGVSVEGALETMRWMNLGGIVFTEHAPQLYCSQDDFWHGRHVETPALWRSGPGRMDQYRALVEPVRSPTVRMGLEVELDADGDLTLRDEDRQWPDLLVGALHWVPGSHHATSRAGEAKAFLRACEGLCRGGIDVLAHPLRWLRARENPRLAESIEPLADILARTGVAAELNFHKKPPPARWVEACLSRGVKFALGSDAHEPWQVGLITPHVAMLRQLAGREDIADLLAFS
jgi:histidinol phosphatase-like PHP family hydrolase